MLVKPRSTRTPHLGPVDDVVDVLEPRRIPSRNADSCFYLSRPLRSSHPLGANSLIWILQSGPKGSQRPIHPGNQDLNMLPSDHEWLGLLFRNRQSHRNCDSSHNPPRLDPTYSRRHGRTRSGLRPARSATQWISPATALRPLLAPLPPVARTSHDGVTHESVRCFD